ncbi:MAG TPA: hypothetical protein VMP01_10635 [Pirellulaceae bacterium]|nr:hypothetical protein [Pirellulaceae bacterium]
MNLSRPLSLLVITLVALACLAPNSALAQGKKPGGTTYKYTLTDLLGFPDNGYQSQGQFITNRNVAGNSLIAGNSRLYPDPQGPAIFHPALWNIGADGKFPDTDPVDLGLPSFAREAQPTGLNSSGFVVARTSWSNAQDADGNWIFPSYVDLAGVAVQELPGSANRNTSAQAINDAWTIVGTLEATTDDPRYPMGIKSNGAVWQVQADGTVSNPLSLGDFHPDDINNYGVMAGMMSDDGYPAIGWLDGTTLNLVRMAPSARFLGARINALNDYPVEDARLAVVGDSTFNEAGQYDAADSQRGVVWRPYNAASPTTVLGTLGGMHSTARDVNQAEQIVGDSSGKRGGQFAFVYANGTMTNLNAITDVGDRNLQSAYGINDDGDIVGFMQIPRPISEQRGFLLRPITP